LGLQPFTYEAKGKPMNLSYYRVPEECIDDAELLIQWGNSGFGAALRAAAKKIRIINLKSFSLAAARVIEKLGNQHEGTSNKQCRTSG
jgi:hypothetical protein